jgi:GNAT superfamily N-acetyltransferase
VSQFNESITFRRATSEDDDFLLQIYKSSRGDDLRNLGWDENRVSEFLDMQYQAQRTFEQRDHQQATDEIILSSGERAGRLLLTSGADEMRCVDIALLPKFRNRGLGTFLLQRLQKQAAATNKPLRLQVIRFNRAVNLFERLGFVVTSETGSHVQMEWTPPKSQF